MEDKSAGLHPPSQFSPQSPVLLIATNTVDEMVSKGNQPACNLGHQAGIYWMVMQGLCNATMLFTL